MSLLCSIQFLVEMSVFSRDFIVVVIVVIDVGVDFGVDV
jgi:hypothetical protein